MTEHTPHWSKDVETRDGIPCPVCNGARRVNEEIIHGFVTYDEDCSMCDGEGEIDTLVLAKEQVTRE